MSIRGYQQKLRLLHKVVMLVLLMVLAVQVAVAEVSGSWIYEKITVGADQQELYTATLQSRNSIHLLSPYDGLNRGLIMIRKVKSGEPEVLFAVDKGQFQIGKTIRVRIDGGNAQWITVDKPNDRRSDLLFIAEPVAFINQIKNAKKLNIAAQLSHNGEKIFDFNVDGLDLTTLGL